MDIFEYINFYYSGFHSSFSLEFSNYYNQLKKYVEARDLGKVRFCVETIFRWYDNNAYIYERFPETLSNRNRFNEFLNILKAIEQEGESNPYYPKEIKLPQQVKDESPIIFFSHSSVDEKYGNALRDFICGLGVKDDQLIYTSHELHKIPLGKNIYKYLFENIHKNILMLILWSDTYLESPACLCELGALQVAKGDYIHVFTPSFEIDNPKYQRCPTNRDKLGISLGGKHLKANLIELKNKVEDFFKLERNSETKTSNLIDKFMQEIQKIEAENAETPHAD